MKSKILFFIIIFISIGILGSFYLINQENYNQIKKKEAEIVKHPELLPKKEYASFTSFGYSNLRADIYWLETIQYVGENALSSEYKKYLYKMLDLITELNPYFEKPYLIGQLLLPNYNFRYENLSEEEQENYNKEGQSIGLKGIKNFCDAEKVEKIKKEDDLEKIWTDPKYKNPCKSFQIPFSQGFLEYFYMQNNLEASNYYKIASAQEDALDGAKVMAAIMKGKGGDREKSIIMFLSIAVNTKENENCTIFSRELEKVTYAVFRGGGELDADTMKNIENLREKYFKFDPKDEQKIILSESCENYINKAVRELNLYYVEKGNEKYFKETGKNAPNGKFLYDKGYLKFLPTDFQQYDNYGIIYEFDEKSGHFDYKMGDKK